MARKSKPTSEQTAPTVKQAEARIPIAEICRKYGISNQTLYRWKSKYRGLMPSEVTRLKQREDGNRRLKQIVADLSLDKDPCRTSCEEGTEARCAPRVGQLRERALADE